MNSFTEQEKLELYARQIHDSGIDITPNQKEWTEIAYACASQGEAGREPFQLISSLFSGYSREECDRHYSYCLKTSKNCVSIGTIVKIAQDHGIKLQLPKGRRPKSQEQTKQEQTNAIESAKALLNEWACWWYNTWSNRVEIQEPGAERHPVSDRDFSTFYSRLKREGIRISSKDVEHLILSRDFATDDDPFRDYFDTLPEWKEGEPDYIHEFFVGHMTFADPENIPFYDLMLHKWFVGAVGLWLNYVDENPIVPVLYGEQHIGKTFFVRRILPPELQPYLFPVNPAARVDKDFEIAMSETPIMFLDEFNVANMQKSEAYKYAATSSKSYLRDSYGHFREMRDRKAALIAATNHENHLKGTVNLNDHPLPYKGAYAQALYLLKNGYNPKPDKEESLMITEHAQPYVMTDDVVEALRTFVREPAENEKVVAMSAGDLLRELGMRGFHGKVFSTVNIGKAMKAMGFTSKKIHGYPKYRVVIADFTRQQREQEEDAKLEEDVDDSYLSTPADPTLPF